jgi:hypothetical protein
MKHFSVERSKLLLKSRYILYFLFTLAMSNVVLLGSTADYTSIVILVLVGFLTSFFSKNMIVILCVSMVVANILKYGSDVSNPWIVEGFDEKKDGPIKEALKSEEKEEEKDYEEEFVAQSDSKKTNKQKLVEKDNLEDLRHEMKLGFKRMSQNIDSLSMSNMFN